MKKTTWFSILALFAVLVYVSVYLWLIPIDPESINSKALVWTSRFLVPGAATACLVVAIDNISKTFKKGKA